MAKLIEFKNVALKYGKKKVLENVSFTVNQGDYIGLVGPNGSGKTTLLKAAVGALKPAEGTISYFQNGSPSDKPPRFGYLPQHQLVDASFPLSCFQVALMGRYAFMGRRIRPNAEDRKAVEECLNKVGMTDKSRLPFSSLSGGQQQRVLLARALTGEPDILLLDEPTTGMDIGSAYDTLNMVRELNKEGMTIILVSHQIEVIAQNAEWAGILKDTLTFGPVAEILSGENLSKIYGRSVVMNSSGYFSAENIGEPHG
ncbi:MAG: metal ABC transporter ATP-binding protein [bacterium]|nr:metal ABC transporter ATP-binding protein [bacterium]